MSLQANNYLHITAAGTYVVKTGFTGLETVKVNTGAGSSTITVTEGDASEVIAVIDSSAVHKHDFDLSSLNGCRVVVAGGAPDVTVIYQ